jgi:hypothetical protein
VRRILYPVLWTRTRQESDSDSEARLAVRLGASAALGDGGPFPCVCMHVRRRFVVCSPPTTALHPPCRAGTRCSSARGFAGCAGWYLESGRAIVARLRHPDSAPRAAAAGSASGSAAAASSRCPGASKGGRPVRTVSGWVPDMSVWRSILKICVRTCFELIQNIDEDSDTVSSDAHIVISLDNSHTTTDEHPENSYLPSTVWDSASLFLPRRAALGLGAVGQSLWVGTRWPRVVPLGARRSRVQRTMRWGSIHVRLRARRRVVVC